MEDFPGAINALKRLTDDNIASIQADANMSDANKADSIKQVRDEYTKQSAALVVKFAGETRKRKAESPPETDEEKAIRIAYENKSDTVIRSLRDDKVAEAVYASRAETGKAQQHARGLYREQQGFLASLREDIPPDEAKKQFNLLQARETRRGAWRYEGRLGGARRRARTRARGCEEGRGRRQESLDR